MFSLVAAAAYADTAEPECDDTVEGAYLVDESCYFDDMPACCTGCPFTFDDMLGADIEAYKCAPGSSAGWHVWKFGEGGHGPTVRLWFSPLGDVVGTRQGGEFCCESEPADVFQCGEAEFTCYAPVLIQDEWTEPPEPAECPSGGGCSSTGPVHVLPSLGLLLTGLLVRRRP